MLVIVLFFIIGSNISDNNLSDLDFIEKIITFVIGSLGLFFYGIIAKLLFEFIPKLLIQYVLINIYFDKIKMSILWSYFFMFGVVVSLSWWSESGFRIILNLNTSVAIYNLLAISVSPFILKNLGWDVVEKTTRALVRE